MIRPLALVLVAILLVGLFGPGTVAAADPATGAETLSAPSGGEMPVFDRLRTVAVAPGLSRADTEGVLEQPTRGAVYAAIESTPGASLDDVAAAVGVAKSTVRYHVGVLRDAGLVEAAEAAGALRVAPAEIDAELAATLRADATGAVLHAVAANEPASVTAVADATGRAVSTVSYHLSALEERGLVERERAGEAVVTSLTPAVRRAVSTGTATADD